MPDLQVENISKNDALDILDRIIGFVNNCDTKASIMLGIYGVLSTILFTSKGIIKLKNIIITSWKNGMRYDILYLILIVFSSIVFVFGIYKLFQVLFPKTDCSDKQQDELDLDSKVFFGNIAKNPTYKQYKEKLLNCNDDDYINDIISQIYLNAFICDAKFKNYKIGFLTSFIGCILFVVFLGIGILIY
ncbi:MAG: hypothetical protein N4A64_09515 [Marinisporobacter sp.]|jgi:uncharacterized membrane protein YqjE|nr:hypothetical protein [Marinisporobacter sp.]